jgi:methylthioribose-1-phosphate isomerase
MKGDTSMKRADDGLAFMLRYENVAWYEDGKVRILDRRIYPIQTEYVICTDHIQVAEAIAGMVTQSGGPYVAASMGMALAAYEAREKSLKEFSTHLEDAAYRLSHARPTTSEKMARITDDCFQIATHAKLEEKAPDVAVFNFALVSLNNRYERALRSAGYLVDLIPDNGTVMTQCFAETFVGMMLKECRARGNAIKVICAETRPYFQGARLTASVARDMDFDVTVITDNMPGYVLKARSVDIFTSAADVISMDGHIVNKIGTFQIALAANYWGIPYFVTGTPNPKHPTLDTVKIEERDGKEVLEAMGRKTTMQGVKGYYPTFDITPPNLCDGIVTDKGIFSPFDLARYFDKDAS